MNPLKIIFLVLSAICAGLSISSNAQYAVYGEVVDSVSKECEPYVTYRIFAKGDTEHPVIAGATDESGKFMETISDRGGYVILFVSVGRRIEQRQFELTPSKPKVDLGIIEMVYDVSDFEEVVVSVRKPVIEADMDRVAYNVTEDPASTTSTVLDMLRKVPKVVVDGNDKITVNGSSSFKVYVNGRPDQMMSKNENHAGINSQED